MTSVAQTEGTVRPVETAGRGRDADAPGEIPLKGWRDVAWRVWAEISNDRVTITAAGATFFLLLALFPALTAFVSVYGFVADPVTIADHISFLGGMMPQGGLDLIKSQIDSLVSQDPAALSFGFLLGLALALWSANSGVKTLFEAMNIVYDETEKRSFIKLNLISLAFTFGGIVVGILLIVCVGVVPAMLAIVGLDRWTETLIWLLRWPLLLVVIGIGISLVYRYGPSRDNAKWRWITWGAALATAVWIAASIGFSVYLENFADYNATYGSLGATIGFLMWTYISLLILLVGAEINSEIEHQTARDSTVGPARPMGERGAVMADTLGRAADSVGSDEKVEDLPERDRRPNASLKRGGSGRRLFSEASKEQWIGALVIALYRLATGTRKGKKSRNDMPTGRSSDPE